MLIKVVFFALTDVQILVSIVFVRQQGVFTEWEFRRLLCFRIRR